VTGFGVAFLGRGVAVILQHAEAHGDGQRQRARLL
jgi:hypothetical protein